MAPSMSSALTPNSERRHNYQEVVQIPSASTSRRRKTYRGGFHTSICDIFRDPHSRTDCCAVACCGVLASDRNRYLLSGERPPLWRRVLLYFVIPFLFIGAIGYFTVDVPVVEDGEDGGDGGDGELTMKVPPLGILWSFYAYIGIISIWAWWSKRQLRTQIMTKLYEEWSRESGQELNQQQLRAFLRRHNLDLSRAHYSCSCCYTHDNYFYSERDEWNSQSLEGGDNNECPDEDCCTKFWDFLSQMFWCCGCWCQCCGACAIAQEEREVNRLTRYEQQEIDYITFQPYSEYFPSIQYLRENQIKSPWEHLQATSELSRKILRNVAGVLILLILFALSDIDSNFTWENMIVVLLTLGQAFFIEYLVHWRWNRFNLSFDSVAKYFACGFFLATPLAVMFEMIVSTLSLIVGMVIANIIVESNPDLTNELASDPKAFAKDIIENYTGIFVFFQFVNAFCVAALVEEMVKYFSYRMVVTPDLNPRLRAVPLSTNVSSEEADHVDERRNSKKSTGSGITVAMVSVALGFACCENLLYVFVYSPPSIGNEISVLLVRSFFPVHPLCAAIQSIGVCKRDLEGDKRYGLGRIIAPAILLHGTFDFVLMVAALFQQVQNIKEGNDDDSTAASPEKVESVDLATQLPALVAGLVLVVCGNLYYVIQSRAQTRRLGAMDNEELSGIVN